jgi:hypothetical protein
MNQIIKIQIKVPAPAQLSSQTFGCPSAASTDRGIGRSGANLERARRSGPKRMSRNGIGIMSTAMQPSSVEAQRAPSAL